MCVVLQMQTFMSLIFHLSFVLKYCDTPDNDFLGVEYDDKVQQRVLSILTLLNAEYWHTITYTTHVQKHKIDSNDSLAQ